MSRFTYYEGYEVDNEPSDESDTEENVNVSKQNNDEKESTGSSDDEFDKPIREYIEKNFSSTTINHHHSKVKSFENEMENELDQIYNSFLTNGTFPLPIETQKPKPPKQVAVCSDKLNDDDDSESDEPNTIKQPETEIEKLDDISSGQQQTEEDKLNDEWLYDPQEDDEDEKWMLNERIKSRGGVDANKSSAPLDETDAILNCPGCMTLVCHDCQRHEKNRSQYRAMFVFNCTIDENRNVKVSSSDNDNKKSKKKNQRLNSRNKRFKTTENGEQQEQDIDDSESNENENQLKPVLCNVCGTELGAYEKTDELYHFYNVLASH